MPEWENAPLVEQQTPPPPAAWESAPAVQSGGLTPEMIARGVDEHGNPLQSVRNIPEGDPVGQSTGTPILEGQAPGFGTQAAASMSTDPEQRRRILGAQLFPGMPEKDATARIFVGVNGRLAAVGKDGKAFYLDPEAPSVSLPTGGGVAPQVRLGQPGAALGTLAGPALPAAGGLAGAALTAPTSVVAGPLVAGAGAAAGDVARQTAANYFDPRPGGIPFNPAQTAGEAASAAGGQLVGAGIVRSNFPVNPLAVPRVDVRNLRRGTAMAGAEAASQQAAAQGVRLSPGQASGLPSLLSYEDVAASGSVRPSTSDIANVFYRGQREELERAGQTALGRVSPQTDKTDAALAFQQGQEDAARLTRQQANAAARPSYEAAQQGGQVMSPDLAQLAEVPAVQRALTEARADYANLYRRAAPETPDFALWDLAKRKLDDMHGVARRAGENTTAMSIDTLRGDLLTHLDTAYPSYAAARATAAPGQRAAARLESATGAAAGEGTEKAWAIVRPVFEGANPRSIAESRQAFISAGRGAEWDAGTRAYLQHQIDAASKSLDGLNPAALRRQIWSNADTRGALQAAMDPQAFRGLENFMGTIEHVAQSRGMNSLTQPRAAGAAAMEEAAGRSPGVRAARAAETLTSPEKLLKGGGPFFNKIADWLTARNVDRISEHLFSDRGMRYLRLLAEGPPQTQKAIQLTSEFLGQTVAPRVLGSPDYPPNRLAPR